MIMLAQSVDNVPAEWLKNAALVLASIIASAYYLKEFFRKRENPKIEPQPLLVEMEEKFVEHSIFDEHVKDTKKQFEVRDRQRSDDLKEAKQSRLLIYTKIETAAASMRSDLDAKHVINEKKIGRINWMLARLCERNRIAVPGEDENL